ncbi:MAG: SIMPL domain-containing protein [Candidatus Cloacimonetes bacterium]|nr:SIMPL domain-containing protein [Candidatus Cloacimonadota bacterium]
MKNKYALILAAGLVIAALVFGIFFYSARNTKSTIRVVGYAKQQFEADIVKWSFSFSELVGLDGLKSGYTKMNDKLNKFKSIWNSLNIEVDEMNIQPVSVRKSYGREGKIDGYELTQKVFIVSKQVEKVENITANPTKFTNQDIAFEYSQLQYFSTKLPELKMELLAKATKNARERAVSIAESAGGKIGSIEQARAGIFQITEPYSTEIASYGVHQTSSKNKIIKVTVTAYFPIK